MRPAFILVLLASSWALAACGEDGAPPVVEDGGGSERDGGLPGPEALPSGAVLAPPAPPARAVAPELGPCPDGWRSLAPEREGGASVCEPWPEAGWAACPGDQAWFPGEPGCRLLGAACPPGDFPDDLPAALVLYVSAGARSGGDGSRVAPFATLGDALAAATPGATVAVAAGDYDEAVVLPDGVTLRGACAAGTRIAYSTRDEAPATVTVRGTGVVVRDLTLGGARSGLLVDGGAEATIRSVVVDGATETGLRVHHMGRATIRDIIIRETQTDPDDGLSAFGMVVEFAGSAEVSHALIAHNGLVNVIVDSPDSSLVMNDSVIRDGRSSEPDGTYGVGIGIQNGGHAELSRVVVEANRYTGASAQGGGDLVMTDCVVRDTTPAERGGIGPGLAAVQGGVLRLSRVLVERNAGAGILADNGPAVMQMDDVVIRDSSEGDGDWPGAVGLFMSNGTSTLDASRLCVEGMSYAGLVLAGAGVEGSLSDLRLIEVDSGASGMGGAGLVVQMGARADASRVLVRAAHETGVLTGMDGAILNLEDLTVRDTESQVGDGTDGRGAQVQGRGTMSIMRALIEGNRGAGLAAVAGSTLTAGDVVVRRTEPVRGGVYQGFGVGVLVTEDADVHLQRLVVDGSTGFGVIAGRTSTFVAEDLRIMHTRDLGREILGSFFGRALDVQGGCRAEVTRAIFEDNRETAVHVASTDSVSERSQLTLRDAIVRDQRSQSPDRRFGDGLVVRGGGLAVVHQARFERIREVSVAAWNEGSEVRMTGVEILDTLTNECALDTCVDEGGGIGVGAYDGASVTAERFLITRSALAGAQVGESGELDLTSGEVSHGIIGANVQNPTFDVGRITADVTYRDNEVNLDSTVLPVPTPGAQFDAPAAE